MSSFCTLCNPDMSLKRFMLPCGWTIPLFIENDVIHNPNCVKLQGENTKLIREYPCKYVPNENNECINYSECKLISLV
jgi:hypothetical protein